MKTGMDKEPRRFNNTPASRHNVQRLATSALDDNRTTTTLQRQLMQGIDNSPVMTLQRQRLENTFGEFIQRVAVEDEELLQGKLQVAQRQGPEEEELLQGKFETAQLQNSLEDEEPLQGKFVTTQRQGPEEEELLQGKFETAQLQNGLEDDELLQGKFKTVQRQSLEEEEEPLQGKFNSVISPIQMQQENQQSGNQTGMPGHLKAGIESLSGLDMSDVRVHYNSSKPAQLNALAYAQGKDIHLGSGQERHLPHESWHVVQQAQGRVRPTMQMSDHQINDDKGLEKEADVMGAKALSTPGQKTEAPLAWTKLAEADQQLQDSGVQRKIYAGRNRWATKDMALERFKLKRKEDYKKAQQTVGETKKLIMNDEAIKDYVETNYIDVNETFYYETVFNGLSKEINERIAKANFEPGVSESGVEVEMKSKPSVNLPIPMKVDEKKGKVDMHPAGDVLFKAKAAAKVPKGEKNNWTLGLTQTLLSSARRLRLVHPQGVTVFNMSVATPHNDRRPGDPPWYDHKDARHGLDKEFQLVTGLNLDDRPGWDISKHPSQAVLDSTGIDKFKTWFILRHDTGEPVKFLYEWTWQVNYTPDGKAALTAETGNTIGAGARLDGARASDSKKITTDKVQWSDMPTKKQFKQMKKNARKSYTPRSGMMSTKNYGKFVKQFNEKVSEARFTDAATVLTTIKNKLDLMDKKGNEYWKSVKLKALNFKPLYNAVVKMLNDVNALK